MTQFANTALPEIRRLLTSRHGLVPCPRRCVAPLRILSLALVFALPLATFAQTDAIDDARTALKESENYPWYDSEQDDLQRVDVFPKEADDYANRASNWESQPPQTTRSNWDISSTFSMLLKVFFVILIVVLLGLLIWLAVWIFSKTETWQADGSEATEVADSSSDVDRVENLPFKVDKPYGDLLAEARRQYEAGNYRKAVIYLFSYKLIQLDKNQFIHLTKGKTNRQYLRELRCQSRLLWLLEGTMLAFEDVFFGNHELERREFETCWRGLDEFHRLINQGAAS